MSGVFQDSNCMTRSGKPLIALWGLGFNDRNLDPSLIQEIIGTLKQRGFAGMGGDPFLLWARRRRRFSAVAMQTYF